MKNRIIGFVARWLAGGIMREISEGKRGPVLYRWYWWAQGKKGSTGWILVLLLAGVYAVNPQLAEQIGPTVGTVAGLLVAWGFLDAKWRAAVPPGFVGDTLHLLLSLGPVLSGLTALAVAHLSPEWSERVEVGAGAVAMATAWLAARMAPPPFDSDQVRG